jgi:hypothetical protein
MTEEKRFSTITITKNADLSPTYASLRGGGFSAKKQRRNLSSLRRYKLHFGCQKQIVFFKKS